MVKFFLRVWCIFVFLIGCQHYSSNVEIIYKNPNGQIYKNSGTNILEGEEEQEIIEKKPIKKTTQEKPKDAEPKNPINHNDTNLVNTNKKIENNQNTIKEPLQIEQKNTSKYHTVQKGETYYSIARLYNIPPKELIAMNENKDSKIMVGEKVKLYKEEASKVKTPIANSIVNPVAKKDQETNNQITAKQKEVRIAKIEKPALPLCNKQFESPIHSNNIMYNFGETMSGGIKNDGIIYKVLTEEYITVAEEGEVVYVGDGFSDYGNIVIIKHKGNYFSIYGYLKDVKNLFKGEVLKRRAKLSLTSKKEGKFYFSIRKGKIAINPANIKC